MPFICLVSRRVAIVSMPQVQIVIYDDQVEFKRADISSLMFTAKIFFTQRAI